MAPELQESEVKVRTLDEFWAGPDQYSYLDTQEYFVNMGPQHPSTHGVLRFLLKLDGETIREAWAVPGHIHRGIEKMGEHLNYRQFIHLTDRLDYLSAHINNWAVCLAVEQGMGLEEDIKNNGRINVIRTIIAELTRIASHLLWWGVMGMDLGAITAMLYGFRDREYITDIFEETCGARLTMNYFQPGGLMYDIPDTFEEKVSAFIKYLKPKLDEDEKLLSGNPIFLSRTKGIGILSPEMAVARGATGPTLRGSGIRHDARKAAPYGCYDQVAFDVPIGETGDSFDRYHCRFQELRQSCRIIEQLLKQGIPDGPHSLLKPTAKLKPEPGEYYTRVETARGEMGLFIVSDGSEKPYRVKLRSPNFCNLSLLGEVIRGWRIADVVSIASSFDLVIPDIDR